jgi:hypothetical protein
VETGSGEMITESRRVERDGAESVRIELQLGSGELVIAGGASALLEADFSYNVPAWRPEVEYTVRDGRGLLTLRQPEGDNGASVRNARQRWELRLADRLPIELRIKVGAATVDLTSGDLALAALDIDTGAGSLRLDLSATRHPFDAALQGGVINTTLRLPATLGAHVAVRAPIATVNGGGLQRHEGGYVNGTFGATGTPLRVRITGGVANVILAGR